MPPITLKNYARGQFVAGAGDLAELRSAVTGDVVALTSSQGLDFGGMCRGLAYRIAASARKATLDYLRAREQVTTVYLETMRRVVLAASTLHPARDVSALVFVVDRSHPQYAGRLDLERTLHLVRQGHGQSGANRDYVLSTVHALEALGLRDRDLHLLAERLKGAHGEKRE